MDLIKFWLSLAEAIQPCQSRNDDRCPTRPGELLRKDVIPVAGSP